MPCITRDETFERVMVLVLLGVSALIALVLAVPAGVLISKFANRRRQQILA